MRFPIGDLVHTSTGWRIDTWWIKISDVDDVKRACADWERNGFKLRIGSVEDEYDEKPEVITAKWQERGEGRAFCGNGLWNEGANVGDVMVWLEIVDTAKAKEFLTYRSDVPCALVYDATQYESDGLYRETVDTFIDYYVTYYTTGKAKQSGVVDSEKLISMLYDV